MCTRMADTSKPAFCQFNMPVKNFLNLISKSEVRVPNDSTDGCIRVRTRRRFAKFCLISNKRCFTQYFERF